MEAMFFLVIEFKSKQFKSQVVKELGQIFLDFAASENYFVLVAFLPFPRMKSPNRTVYFVTGIYLKDVICS
jgi:hypothetical protein